MIEAAERPDRTNVIAVEGVPRDRVHMYGVVGIAERKDKLSSLSGMVEKPAPDKRRRTSSSPVATSCSRRSSISWLYKKLDLVGRFN
jgi:UTP-glucose-1-phosphate uridylyltransferase